MNNRQRIIENVPISLEIERYGFNPYKEKIHCPFHDDSTPSFSFSDSLKVYHCFGCGAKGTVIEFTKEMEALKGQYLTQNETIDLLAKLYNVEIHVQEIKEIKRKTAEPVIVSEKIKTEKAIYRIEQKLRAYPTHIKLLGYYLIDLYSWGMLEGSETLKQLGKVLKHGRQEDNHGNCKE